jgi:hypothetical protein
VLNASNNDDVDAKRITCPQRGAQPFAVDQDA